MSDEMTPDEFISSCLTVGELVKALLELPQDAILVKQSGGDCDGYVPLEREKLKPTAFYLRPKWNEYEYHGPFDDTQDRNFERKHYGTKYLNKVKGVVL